jgi:hypothetical protein
MCKLVTEDVRAVAKLVRKGHQGALALRNRLNKDIEQKNRIKLSIFSLSIKIITASELFGFKQSQHANSKKTRRTDLGNSGVAHANQLVETGRGAKPAENVVQREGVLC